MAEKKTTRADAVAAGTKKPAAKRDGKSTPPKKKAPERVKKGNQDFSGGLAPNVVIAVFSVILLILFVVIAVNPDGALLRFLKSVILGLLGQAGFYFSIPALLYLFIIQTLGRKHSPTMRSVCLVLFVFFSGSIFHLVVQDQGMAEGLAVIPDLYTGGLEGRTGGVFCGGLAMLLRWLCGNVIAYLVLIVCAILTLLGSMEITIPSIIRAIANRPREEFDEEEEEDNYIEPAAVVVNHIANKKIEQKRRQRQVPPPGTAQEDLPPVSQQRTKPQPRQERKPAQVPQIPQAAPAPEYGTPSRGADVMNTIDLDIDTPIYGTPVKKETGITVPKAPQELEERTEDRIPVRMPEFVKEEPILRPQPVVKSQSTQRSARQEAPKAAEVDVPAKVTGKEAAESARQVAAEIAQGQQEEKQAYCFPPIDLLRRPAGAAADGTEEMRENSARLNETLASFHIDAHIINVTRGPSVTRYEVELDKGVRLSKLTSCADDIALSLGASGVRIAAVPGKISIVGIEVPNRTVTTVSLREVIDSPAFANAKGKSSFSVGKDIAGNCIVGNIAKMPHMLIAGTTGSGKSVCMNSIIISLLYKAGPEDVKLIMVDPKMVELGIYNGIPQLLIPVVTDPKKAAGSLQWAVTEMLRRYKLMSDAGVRDLESYNSIMEGEEDGQRLPQVIVIIDELADLMLVAAKEVEDSICRIAQMGRASGMHLIIATQRPSADVITGLMKANIPSRIAFSVASAMESRIILDTTGAEKLVGKGDMLYAPIGCGKPLRVQGCFVTDSEVEAVAGFVKEHYVADYNQQVLEEIEKKAQQTGKNGKGASSAADPEPNDEELEGDELLPAAVEVVLETGQASVSMLQRRLKLGYARAARIVDEMEEKGIVGPFQGSKPRSILITKEEWAARNGQAAEEEPPFDPDVPDELL